MKRRTRKKPRQAKRMADKTAAQVDPRFAPVVEAFEPCVVRKRMFSSSNILTVKGKIFAMLARGKFVGKLPKERVHEIVKVKKGKRFNPGHGKLMKEWVALEDDVERSIALAKQAYEFVNRGGA